MARSADGKSVRNNAIDTGPEYSKLVIFCRNWKQSLFPKLRRRARQARIFKSYALNSLFRMKTAPSGKYWIVFRIKASVSKSFCIATCNAWWR